MAKNETAHKALDVFLDAVSIPFKAAADFIDQTTTAKPDLSAGVPKLKAVRFKEDHPDNADVGTLASKQLAILGEFSNKHYVILDVGAGTILPGVFHLDRFEQIPIDEL